MYVADRDRVLSLSAAPEPDVGAPLPAVVCTEGHLLLAYIVSEPDPNWDGTYVTVVDTTTDGKPIAIAQFTRPRAHLFGPPNDEAFAGHPLAARGLKPYAAWEVEHSSWIRALSRMNSVHPAHRDEHFAHLRHFIFAFHDTTFECVAADVSFDVVRCSIASALHVMTQRLADGCAVPAHG